VLTSCRRQRADKLRPEGPKRAALRFAQRMGQRGP